MAYSKKDIENINSRKLAVKDRVYKTVDGDQYIGQVNGSLSLITKFERTLRNDVNDNDNDISSLENRTTALEKDVALKDYIVDVDKKLSNLECKLIAMNIILG